MSDRPDTSILERKLGYVFLNRALLETALTHPSFLNENRALDAASNHRLEFLGDAVLGVVAAGLVYERIPDGAEAVLSKAREAVVMNENLAGIARKLDIERHMQLGGSEKNDGKQGEQSRLADALEALIGAIYLDAGPAHATTVVREILRQHSQDLIASHPGGMALNV